MYCFHVGILSDVLCPICRYALQHGAAFGLAHGLTQLALLRPGPQDPGVPGLYFVGASSRPGNGVPLVMLGAKQTAERVLADLK
jgi:phytoene desaturase (3,4-didehydrolycopene-forming)